MAFNESIYNDFKHSVYSDLTAQQVLEFYTKFANYYSDICKFEDYRSHEIAVNGFVEFGLEKSIRILDLGAGQGPCGSLLRSLSYDNVDGLDGTPSMLNVAKSRGIYKNYIHCLIEKDTKLPIEDNTYDAIIAASSIGIGHIGIEILPELVRITKAGGIITWSYEDPKYENDPNYYSNYIKLICDEGKCREIPGYPKKDSKPIYAGKDGLFYAIQVL